MIKSCILLLTTFSLFNSMVLELIRAPECTVTPSTDKTMTISVKTTRDHSGEWFTEFSAQRDSLNETGSLDLDVVQRVTECGTRQIIKIQGALVDNRINDCAEGLLFHNNTGANAVVIKNGKTAFRKGSSEVIDHASVLTNRLLKDNELFEVTLDKINEKQGSSIGIGVTIHSPTDYKFTDWMKDGAWMYFSITLYVNGKGVSENFGPNLAKLKVGDRVGVMRKHTGTLHFFVNGVHHGPVAFNVPRHVYGAIDLWESAVQATIVDKSSACSAFGDV